MSGESRRQGTADGPLRCGGSGGTAGAGPWPRRRTPRLWARNPGGGAGSSMRSSARPGVEGGVQVAGQRPVVEADEHAPFDLLDGLGLGQVGPDPPVLLGRIQHLVVDPARCPASAAAGGSGGTGTARPAAAPGPPRRAQRRGRRCARTPGRRRRRRTRRRARPAPTPTLRVHRAAGSVASDVHLGPGRVEADHEQTRRRGDPGHLALAAADVEHRSPRRQVLGDERQDLLGVLGVGAVGELVLPPVRMGLPRVRDAGSGC